MYLVLSICVSFISLMQSANGTQCLNATFLPALSGAACACNHSIDIVP